jgi:hypothetical protein
MNPVDRNLKKFNPYGDLNVHSVSFVLHKKVKGWP